MRRKLGILGVVGLALTALAVVNPPVQADFAPVEHFHDEGVSRFSGLDCPTADTCYVVGTSQDDPTQEDDYLRINGVVAAIRDGEVQPHRRATDTLRLSDVACWSESDCVATGYRIQRDRYVLQRLDDGVPDGFSDLTQDKEVTTVDCEPTGDRCWAAGNGILELDGGEPGTFTSIPGVRSLSDIECPVTGWCIAAGLSAPDAEAVVVEIEDGDPGSARILPGVDYVVSIGCWARERCVAAGGASGITVELVDGTTTPHQGQRMRYFDIECVSSARCYGAGDWGDEPAVVAFLNGEPQRLHTENSELGSGLWSAIECVSTTSCTLTGGLSAGVVQEMPTALSNVALSTSETPAEPTHPPTFTAIVHGGDGSGTVRFMQASDPANDEIRRRCHSQPLVPIGGGRFRATCTAPVPPDFNELHPKTYSIIARYSGDRVALASQSAPLTQVVLETQTIAFDPPAGATYGDADLQLAATASTGLPVTFSASTPATCTVSAAGLLHIEGAGDCTVTAHQAGDATYHAASATRTVVIAKARLTVTADDATRPYGTDDPAFTATVAGFLFDDTAAVVSGAPTLTTTATAASPPGTYPIDVDVTSMHADDYAFEGMSGTLTVTRATTTVSVTAAPDQAALHQAITLDATVATAATSGDAPTGTVLFHVDGAALPVATATVVDGHARALVLLTGGPHTVVASYQGDTRFLSSTSSPSPTAVACTQTITDVRRPGALRVRSGTTCLRPGAVILGSITVDPGASLSIDGASVVGSISASRPDDVRICGTWATTVRIQGATGFVTVGDPATGCAGNTFVGPIAVDGGRGGLVVSGNTYRGSLAVTDNRGAGPLPGQETPVVSDNRTT